MRRRFLRGQLLLCTLVLGATAPAGAAGPYEHAAVAADHPVASRAGVEVLRQGGNAVDAAVATSFCLSVVRPYSCGLGGGGFMVICKPAAGGGAPTAVALNYRETAPAAVGAGYFTDLDVPGASRAGAHAAGVPGTVAGLLRALQRHGTLDRAAVLAPAIRAAEQGFRADANFVEAAEELAARLEAQPHLRDAIEPVWSGLCRGGRIAVGDVVTNPGLARALRLIARDGRRAFYGGPIGDAVAAVVEARGGPLTRGDLADYAVREVEPLRGSFRGLEVLAMPPPSSGGVATLQVLGILERVEGLAGFRHNRAPYVHAVTEALKHAFADRAAWLADPDHVHVPVERLLSASYLDGRAVSVSMLFTRPPAAYGSSAPAPAGGGTSHLSVIDADGMAVACTETINLVYGSLVAVPGFGFVLNDEMDDFTTAPGEPNAFGLRQSDGNVAAPGKRPLSSMSPTIVLSAGRPVIVAGASGGPRIISATLQAVLNCALFEMAPEAAVTAPRFHHQWLPDVLYFEKRWDRGATVAALEALGHETARRDGIGVVQLIRAGPDGIRAASDPRKGGAPAGY